MTQTDQEEPFLEDREGLESRDLAVQVEHDGWPSLLVGVGASAGGLESLERMFENMPADVGLSFVVVQHLSADFESHMVDLLQRRTRLPVQTVQDNERVRAGRVYLPPPGKDIEIDEGRLRLRDRDESGRRLTIDRFLSSLAADLGSRSAAVILSGSGSDGARGVLEIHRAGGFVICEPPESAAFPSMPLAAQSAGAADSVLEASEIPSALLDHEVETDASPESLMRLEKVHEICALLRSSYGVDFHGYKGATVRRRIERRLEMTADEDLGDYLARLSREPRELDALYHDLLIGVTEFFRDTEAFVYLRQTVLPKMVAEAAAASRPVRVWVPGCASGEEAYSLAILLDEAREGLAESHPPQIFATDLHRGSLEKASRGVFPGSSIEDLVEPRWRRYFNRTGDGYQVVDQIRSTIVFARHDLVQDAPYSDLDLISCRNLLIYLRLRTQKRVLSLFHFGLRPGGMLFLGASESVGGDSDEFEPTHDTYRLFRKVERSRAPVPWSAGAKLAEPIARPRTSGLSARSTACPSPPLLATYDELLDRFMPPSLLVGEHRELLDTFAGADRLLKLKPRRPSTALFDLLAVDRPKELSVAMSRALRRASEVNVPGLGVDVGGEWERYRVVVHPLSPTPADGARLLIRFEDGAPRTESAEGHRSLPSNEDLVWAGQDEDATRILELEEELTSTRGDLSATVEELQSTNEELIASNEELQSSNEELHSVNDELSKLNSEHRRKLEELKVSNADLEHLLESTDIGTLFLDEERRIRRFTARVGQVFDLQRSDIGRPLSTFSHRLKGIDLDHRIASVIERNEPYENQVTDLDGVSFFLRILPYRAGGAVVGAVVTLVDLTTLLAARQQVDLLSSLVETSTAAIIGKYLDGRVISWNEASELLFGYPQEEAIGRRLRDMIVPSQKREEYFEWLEVVRGGGRIGPVDTVRRRRDGSLVDVSLSMAPILDADGEVEGVSLAAHDISARKEVQRELERSEEKYLDLFQNAPDMYLVVSGLSFEVVQCNRTLLDRLGVAEDEVVGRPVFELFTSESCEAARSAFESLGEDSEVRGVRLMVESSDDRRIPVSLQARAVRDGGRITEIRALLQDMEVQNRIESELRDAVDQRERFLSMLGHELRNPVNAISSAALLLGLDDAAEETRARARSTIDRQIRHMTRLLDDLLDMSRIVQGRFQLQLQPLDLAQVARDALDTVRAAAERGGIRLESELGEEPLEFVGDPDRLLQLQANLLGNAVKYSSKGDAVRIELGKQDGSIMIRVSDEGIGIDPQRQKSIFEVFEQHDPTLDRRAGGLGLGLSLVKAITELHGGRIEVDSEGPGCGSTFTVLLPNHEGARVEPPQEGESPSRRVVLVEDLEDSRAALQTLLEVAGHEVFPAADGVAGLELIRREKPDFALLDLGLPKMNGYDVAQQVRSADDLDSVRLIALTGYGDDAHRKMVVEAGFDAHLVKPLDLNELRRLLASGVG